MFRAASGSTPRKSSFAQRRGTLRSVAFLLSLALAPLTVARRNTLALRRDAVGTRSPSVGAAFRRPVQAQRFPVRATRDSRKDLLGAAAETLGGPAEAGPDEDCQNVTKALSRRSRAFTQRSSTSSGLPVSATSNISTPS